MRPQQIGSIQIAEKFTLVEIDDGAAEHVMACLRQTSLKGKKVKVKMDQGR